MGLRWWVVALTLASRWCIPAEGGGGGRDEEERERGRSLLGFTEAKGNASYQCSPAGACLPCQHSEKNDEKYHCSETGYHVPLKCTEIKYSDKEENKNKVNRRLSSLPKHPTIVQKHLFDAINNYKVRKLLDDSVKQEVGNQSYITYRSCVPVIGEEKLSVFGFEVIMVGLLLISGPVVYLRQKRISLPGVGFMKIPAIVPRL
ncbi:unnamed protein product [Musa textilis]